VTEASAGPAALGSVPVEAAVAFQCSDDGESVAVVVSGDLPGFVAAGSKRGSASISWQRARIEQPLEILFGPPDQRPTFRLVPTDSELYREQVEGLPVRKWHHIIERHLGARPGAAKPA